MFQSFGFAERLVKEGAHINEVVFWNPGENGIERTKRTADVSESGFRFWDAADRQSTVERAGDITVPACSPNAGAYRALHDRRHERVQ